MKKIKVLHIVPLLDFGGVESHRYIIAKYNKQETIDLIFCCFDEEGHIASEIKKLGYKVYCLNQSPKIPNLMLIYKLYRLIKTLKPDIVHTSSSEANFHGIIASYFAGIKIRIAEEVGLPAQSKKAKEIFKWLYKLSSKVVGVSQKVIDFLILENKVDKDKTKLIYNPFDIDKFKENSTKTLHDEFVIVTVGRLVKEKNHLFLIKSFLEVQKKHKNIKLMIIGDGPLREEIEHFISSQKLNEQVLLLGFRENIIDYLLGSDLFVLPSISEGLPIALIEAMYVGLPSIGTKVGGIPEVIADTENGWLVESGDINGMVDAIEKVVSMSIDERCRVGTEAHQSVMNKFSPELYMRNLINFYKELLHGR